MTSVSELTQAVQRWQRGDLSRPELVAQLVQVPSSQGEEIHRLITELLPQAQPPRFGGPEMTESWREELLSSRARSWQGPHSAGLLVGKQVLLLTDGRRGLVLHRDRIDALPASTSASLELLCQTIVMAQHALEQRELEDLQQQRLKATSTSLSEIDIIP